MIAALVLSDMISGIFKHNGVLGGLLPDFEPRWRPMFTPALEGLEIAPDSLRKLRWLTPDSLAAAGVTHDWVVHVPVEAVSGRFGSRPMRRSLSRWPCCRPRSSAGGGSRD